jgi:aryl-alcohol dehydrogenase-like predicted oxidoreductase
MTAALVLGGSVFGWTVERAAAFAILDRFAEVGGEMIDTAESYKQGESESIVGEWLRGSGMRGRMRIASKMGLGNGLAPDRIRASAEASLARLGVDTIDLYYAHADDPTVAQADVLAAFGALVEAGKVGAVGASNFTAPRLAAALEIAARDGLPGFTACQPRYNLMRRDEYEGPLQQLCVAKGIAVMPYYALARGFLTGKYRSAADLAKSVRGGRMASLLPARAGLLAAMDGVAAETGATLAQISLAWVAAQPGIAAPLASATSVAQLDELMAYRDLTLNPDQLARLRAAA